MLSGETRPRCGTWPLPASCLPRHSYVRVHHRVAQELIQQPAFHGIAGQIAVLGIALQQSLAFEKTSDAMRDGVCQLSQLGIRGCLHPAKLRVRFIPQSIYTPSRKSMWAALGILPPAALVRPARQVNIQIEGASKALDQRDCASAGRRAGESRLDVQECTNAAERRDARERP